CFPFIDHAVLEKTGDMLTRFDDWITTRQGRDNDKPTIAIAHGMDLDHTLHKSIFAMGYDYIALGHDHHLHKHSSGAWYAGSPERWRFDEIKHEKGFIIVQIDEAGEKPEVTPHHLTFERKVVTETIEIAQDDTVESITERVFDLFTEMGLKESWNPKTAARVRLVFEGKSLRLTSFELGLTLESLRMKTLSRDSDFNIVQFVWFVRQFGDDEFTSAAYPEIESEYLIQDPEEDFRAYLDTLEIDKTLDTSVLTKIAVRSLEYAVGKHEGKMNSESVTEDE
ncbi:MAG: metallophosphoesterase family protein, partial [Candidatus Thorarchaeota archaeon]